MKTVGAIRNFWGAQAASLQFAAACREHPGVFDTCANPSGKLPGGTGWQPALPNRKNLQNL